MEYYNNILCVSFSELNAIIVFGTLKSLVYRGRIQAVRRGGGEGTCALYAYNSLPDKYKEKWVDVYGNPSEIMRKEKIQQNIKVDEKARNFFDTFEYCLNGVQTHLKDDVKREYIVNAETLNELIIRYREMELETKMRGNPRRNLWPAIMDLSEMYRDINEHTLPASESRMKVKIREYKKDSYMSLISKKLGNSNTLKITKESGELLIALKRSHNPVYNDSQLFDEYNRRASGYGWKQMKSLRSMVQWFATPSIKPLWYDAVFGEQMARINFAYRHHTELPTKRDSLWYGDGTRLNLYYKGEDGKVYTTNVYEVIDASSEVLLGYYIDDTEDYIAQYHAFRMAVQLSGHKPYEIVTDNQGGHKKNASIGFFSKISVIHRPTAPYNGRSKTIENIFYRFQSQVLHKYPFFTGQNVTTKKDISAPNLEYINANKDSLPTYNELLDIYAKCRTEWNNMKHPKSDMTRMEVYNSTINELTPPVSLRDMIEMFWYITEKPSTFTASGITITVKKKKYTYEVFDAPGHPDHEWRRTHTFQKFFVQYDPYDMTRVRLITLDGRFEREAEPPIIIHRAQQEQTEEEKKFIKQVRDDVNKQRVAKAIEANRVERKYGTSPEQNGQHTPKLGGLSKELQEEIDRRTNKYAIPPTEFQTGKRMKQLSNMDWEEAYKGIQEIPLKKIAEKF